MVHDALATAASHHTAQMQSMRSMKKMPTESSMEAPAQTWSGTMLSALTHLPVQAGHLIRDAATSISNYKATPAEDTDVVDDWTRAMQPEPEEKEAGAADVESGQEAEAKGQQDPAAGSVWEQVRALIAGDEAVAKSISDAATQNVVFLEKYCR